MIFPGTLILPRHGQSLGNAGRRFAGRTDSLLAARGEKQTVRAAGLPARKGLEPDVVRTSLPQRSTVRISPPRPRPSPPRDVTDMSPLSSCYQPTDEGNGHVLANFRTARCGDS
ncbi:histidine phosphatase family protein [Streptomyces sp. NPDC059118]|uniref:histidine phosphatase family protein n=1 Tax=unclassified Streptomyces TaxID=2593676 RepID=UPI00369013AC